jgi:uncharacterized membrane protein (DUF485 family)
MNDYLTTDEKIDYIFNELHAQKRNRILKILFKLILIWLIIYFYFTILINLNKDEIISEISKNVSKIVVPIAKDITNDILKDTNNQTNTNDITNSLIEQINNNPDLINNLK